MNRLKWGFVVLLICLCIKGNAQSPEKYQSIAGFKYLEVVKNTSDTGADLPLIIGFHYSSSTPTEASSDYDQITIPVRIILPQGNFRKRSGYSYFPTDYYEKDSVTQMGIATQTVDSLAAFIGVIVKKYNRKPLVAGFSQGGDISFLLAIYHPDLIQTAFPLAGFIHRQRFEDAENHAQGFTYIHIYQGEADRIVSVDYTRKEVAELRQYFGIVLKTYPGLGHDFSPAMKKDYAAVMMQVLKMQ